MFERLKLSDKFCSYERNFSFDTHSFFGPFATGGPGAARNGNKIGGRPALRINAYSTYSIVSYHLVSFCIFASRMKNPFQYGKTAEQDNFIDRQQDRSFLKQMLYSNQNVILVSPRRWGKSSLVKQAMRELCNEHDDVKVCYIDAFPINSSSEFYHVFAKEVLQATASHWQSIMDSAGKFLKSISPKVSFGPDLGNEFSLSFDFGNQGESEKEILSLPEKIASDKGIQLIICIDEFQHLAKLSDYDRLERQMRSVWQHQQHTSYCLYGSQRHMMTEIFNSTKKPFYRFGQLFPMKKIAKEDWVPYIVRQFTSTNKQISVTLAEAIVDTVEGHSWYVQQLSSAVWNFTLSSATETDFKKALIWCIDVNSESFRQECDSLSELQINLLRAIAHNEKHYSSAETLSKYKLGTSANVVKNKRLLVKKDLINIVQQIPEFQDPLFKIWFLENYKHPSS